MCAEHPVVLDQGLQGERGGGERRGEPAAERHQEERGKSDDHGEKSESSPIQKSLLTSATDF